MSASMNAGEERMMILNLKKLQSLCIQRLQQLETLMMSAQREVSECQAALETARERLGEWEYRRAALLAKWEVTTGASPDSHLAQKRMAYIDSVNDQIRYQQEEVTEARNHWEAATKKLQDVRDKLNHQLTRKEQLEQRHRELKARLNKRQLRRTENLVEERYCRSRKV
ncbi:hypothetical protein [Hahella ganghwensis]|uniref:hypothetical protein n=1 Tax=Hahella ganghwensis TaxID=286420 RepID=UPI0003802E32|nr:hypothetical protein [Hahella ganghwensis]